MDKKIWRRPPVGNMWAQSFGNIADILVPYPEKPSINVTGEMVAYVHYFFIYV
jgi:hypothetical protein